MLASADGSWKFTTKFADLLEFSYDDLSDQMPDALQDADASSVWATVLALKFLEHTYSSTEDRWKLLANKAKTWLTTEAQKLNLQLKDLEEAADKVLREE